MENDRCPFCGADKIWRVYSCGTTVGARDGGRWTTCLMRERDALAEAVKAADELAEEAGATPARERYDEARAKVKP